MSEAKTGQELELETVVGLAFNDLELAPEVLRAVRDAGYTHPTPIQQQAIPLALAGGALIGFPPAGTGETAGVPLPSADNLFCAPIYGEKGAAGPPAPVLLVMTARAPAGPGQASVRHG